MFIVRKSTMIDRLYNQTEKVENRYIKEINELNKKNQNLKDELNKIKITKLLKEYTIGSTFMYSALEVVLDHFTIDYYNNNVTAVGYYLFHGKPERLSIPFDVYKELATEGKNEVSKM